MVLVTCMVTTVGSAGIGARVASAQTPEPSPEQLAEQARRAQAAGRLNEAIDGFARAYQQGGDPSMLFSLAEAHRQAGHDGDAMRTFQTYLRRDPEGARRESAERQLKELEQKARGGAVAKPMSTPPVVPPPARLPPVPAPAVPPTALAPAPVPVTPPPARAPAPPPVVAAPAPPSPPPTPAPSVPPAARPAPSSAPTVASTKSGNTAPMVDLTSPAGPPATTQTPPVPRWVPWTLAATTVALGTGAIISGLSASRRFDELSKSCGQTAEGCGTAPVDDLKSRARRANILWALTSVAAVATGVTVYVNTSAAGVAGLWSF